MFPFFKDKLQIDVIDMNDALKNPTLLGYLSAMTLHGESGMTHTLSYFKQLDRLINAKAIVAYRHGVPVGWALYSLEPTDFIVDYTSDMGVYFQIFVDYPYRRQGIGKALLARARELAKDMIICVCCWSDAATSFYTKNDDGKIKDIVQ